MGVTLLLDGKTGVSSQHLVSQMLKAALLAQEQAGTIRIEVGGQDGSPDSLVVVPTGATIEWPHATLESRLPLDKPATVSDIVFDWLSEESTDPWERAAEQMKIMLVLRGFAEMTRGRWGRRKYLLTKEASIVAARQSARVAGDLLGSCRDDRPEVWKLLDVEIRKAANKRTHKRQGEHDSFQEVDPWLAESPADQERFKESLQPQVVSNPVTIVLGIALAFLVAWLANRADLRTFAAVTAAFFTVVLGLLSLPSPRMRALREGISARFNSLLPITLKPAKPTVDSPMALISGLVFGIPLLTAMTLAARYFVWSVSPFDLIRLALPVVGLAAFVAYRYFQKRAGAAITQRVTGTARTNGAVNPSSHPETSPATVADSAESPGLRARIRAAEQTDGFLAAPVAMEVARAPQAPVSRPLPMSLEIVTVDAIPPISDESSRRLKMIGLRAPAVRKLYQRGILFLSGSTVLFAAAYWLTSEAPFEIPAEHTLPLPPRFPVYLLIAFVGTLLLLKRKPSAGIRSAIWRRVFGLTGTKIVTLFGVSGGPVIHDDEEVASIRPFGLAIIAWFWVLVVLLLTPSRYAHLATPHSAILTAASFASLFAYQYWMRRNSAALEQQYPYQPPLNLLALRVFAGASLDHFLELIHPWHWIGTWQRLDGPDTVGQKASDLIHYFSGRVEDSVVEDAIELRAALDGFDRQPDGNLRFPENTIQCTDATWKSALQVMLDAADVVVVDLSGLSRQNHGIAFELAKLVDQLPLRRIVLLVNDSTDMDVLRDVLTEAWHSMGPNSPNRETVGQNIRLFQMGGSSERKPDESSYDWKRRLRARLDQEQLVGLLRDAALPPRTAAVIDPRRDHKHVRWTRIAMPRPVRWLWTLLFAAFIVVSVLLSWRRLSGG